MKHHHVFVREAQKICEKWSTTYCVQYLLFTLYMRRPWNGNEKKLGNRIIFSFELEIENFIRQEITIFINQKYSTRSPQNRRRFKTVFLFSFSRAIDRSR